MLARHPEMARLFLQFNGFLLQRGELPARLRGRPSCGSHTGTAPAFEWGQHVELGAAVGVTAR